MPWSCIGVVNIILSVMLEEVHFVTSNVSNGVVVHRSGSTAEGGRRHIEINMNLKCIICLTICITVLVGSACGRL